MKYWNVFFFLLFSTIKKYVLLTVYNFRIVYKNGDLKEVVDHPFLCWPYPYLCLSSPIFLPFLEFSYPPPPGILMFTYLHSLSLVLLPPPRDSYVNLSPFPHYLCSPISLSALHMFTYLPFITTYICSPISLSSLLTYVHLYLFHHYLCSLSLPLLTTYVHLSPSPPWLCSPISLPSLAVFTYLPPLPVCVHLSPSPAEFVAVTHQE